MLLFWKAVENGKWLRFWIGSIGMLDSQTFADQVKYVSFLIRRVASIQILEGQIGTTMTPHWENTFFCSFQQLPRRRLVPLKGFLSCHHCALQGLLTRLVRCFQNYRDKRTVSGVAQRSQDIAKKQLMLTLIVCFTKTSLFTPIHHCEKSTA